MDLKREDEKLKRTLQFFFVSCCLLLLVACGAQSKEDVVEKVNEKWVDASYELKASMEVKTDDTPRVYDISVWHTKPEFYRVEINDLEENMKQIIIKNDEGVFLVTPSTEKTYKFQSDWPKTNGQAYLIGALAEDLLADTSALMKEEEGQYIFEAATRNVERTGMPIQQIIVDKKTMLPSRVAMMNEALDEKIVITFQNIDLKAKHKPEEYGVEQNNLADQDAVSSSEIEEDFKVYYPTVNFPNTELVDEVVVNELGKERAILSFKGDKSYTLVQQPIVKMKGQLAVSVAGDLTPVNNVFGALAENTLSWDENGNSFFIASNTLTQEELLAVATSLVSDSQK